MKPILILVFFSLMAIALMAGCSQSQQSCNCPCTCVPTTISTTVSNTVATTATSALPTQPETTTSMPSPIPTVSTPEPASTSLSREVPLSYQAVPLIFTPPDMQNTCSNYENVQKSPCNSFFTWSKIAFSYRGTGYPISIPINTGAYQAINRNISAMNKQREKDSYENKIGNSTYGLTVPLEDQTTYYKAIINDPAQDASYDSILHYLGEIRDKNHLDDNEYAELISLFVQRTFSFNSNPDQLIYYPVAKYPLQTMGDRAGDTYDRSLLLAGLLSRAGYGVSLIDLPSGPRMIVGILGDHQALEYDGYLGIETTVESYLGFYHTKDAFIYTLGGIPENQIAPFLADFKVIKISDGKPYTAGKELNFIWDKWALFKGECQGPNCQPAESSQYKNDEIFITNHMEDRHMVYEYLTKTGRFK